jgi:hypothetical protein
MAEEIVEIVWYVGAPIAAVMAYFVYRFFAGPVLQMGHDTSLKVEQVRNAEDLLSIMHMSISEPLEALSLNVPKDVIHTRFTTPLEFLFRNGLIRMDDKVSNSYLLTKPGARAQGRRLERVLLARRIIFISKLTLLAWISFSLVLFIIGPSWSPWSPLKVATSFWNDKYVLAIVPGLVLALVSFLLPKVKFSRS